MELNRIFREMLEEQGIDYLLSKLSGNYLMDISSLSNSCIYLWRSLLRDHIVEKFLNTSGTEEASKKLAFKYAAQTGFDKDRILLLLTSLSLGMRQAFWGIYPKTDEISLINRFQRNKALWAERLSIYKHGILRILTNGKYGFITSEGETFIPPIYKCASMFSEGLVCVLDQDGKTCFINILGNKEIDINLERNNSSFQGGIGPMRNGYAVYNWKNWIFGIINREGQFTPTTYDYIFGCQRLPIVVQKNKQYGLFDPSTLTEITPVKYSEILPFRNDSQPYTLATLKNGEQIFLDRQGKEVNTGRKLTDSNAKYYFSGSLIFVLDKDGWLTVLDEKLNSRVSLYGLVLDDRFEDTLRKTTTNTNKTPILFFNRRHCRFAKGMGYLFIRSNGTLLHDTPYSMAFQFNNGFAWVKKGYKWCRINEEGEIVNTIRGFEVLAPEYNNLILVRNLQDGLMVLMSSEGEVVFTFPNSEDSEPIMNKNYQYIISTPSNDYVWYNGVLTCIDGRISTHSAGRFSQNLLLPTNYCLVNHENSKLVVYDFEKGTSNIFQLKEHTDRVIHNLKDRKFKRGLLRCRTSDSKYYLIDTETNNTCEIFDSIRDFCQFPIGRKEGKEYLLGQDLNVIAQFDEIVVGKLD